MTAAIAAAHPGKCAISPGRPSQPAPQCGHGIGFGLGPRRFRRCDKSRMASWVIAGFTDLVIGSAGAPHNHAAILAASRLGFEHPHFPNCVEK